MCIFIIAYSLAGSEANDRAVWRSILKILADYNHHVMDNENLKGTYSLASRKFLTICWRFNRQWNTTEAWEEYLTMFSVTAWKKLFPEEKQLHTLQKCKACETQFQVLSVTFPCKLGNKKKLLIFFNKKDLLSSTRFSQKALQELNTLTEENLSKPMIYQDQFQFLPCCITAKFYAKHSLLYNGISFA